MVASSVADALSSQDVERVAALALLDLTDDEKEQIRHQLGAILAYARRVHDVDTTGVDATAHAVEQASSLRSDEIEPSMSNAEALANAPDANRTAGLFKVPRVIG
jgi:aspartyl-tRNA(Asn)/glutamyl-tRNA(Gln) amidotransferase subunit C